MRRSMEDIGRARDDQIKRSVEKERHQWTEKSDITSHELHKVQHMLENIQNKLEQRDRIPTQEIQRDIDLTKT